MDGFDEKRQPLRIARLAFPNHKDIPARRFQGGLGSLVPSHIAVEFRVPELGPGLGCPGMLATRVSVPEAAMDEDGDAIASENDVGSAWQIARLKAKAMTSAVKRPSHQHFRFGVLVTNAAHHLRAGERWS